MRRLALLLALLFTPAWATYQVVPGRSTGALPADNTTNYFLLFGGSVFGTVTADQTCPMPAHGAIRYLQVVFISAPGGTASRTVTLVKNGSDTGLTCTATGATATCSNLDTDITVAPDDDVYWKLTAADTPAGSAFRIGFVFKSTVRNESVLCLNSAGAGQVNNPDFISFGGYSQNTAFCATAQSECQLNVPTPGRMRRLYCDVTTAPTSTDSITATVYVNNSASALTCTVTSSSSGACSDTTHDITLAADDNVHLRVNLNGSAAATALRCGVAFRADIEGLFILSGNSGDQDMSTGSNNFNRLLTMDSTPAAAAAGARLFSGQAYDMKAMYVDVTTAPGGLASYVFTLEDNGSDSSMTCTIAASGQSCNYTTSTAVASTALASTKSSPAAAPAATGVTIGYAARANPAWLALIKTMEDQLP